MKRLAILFALMGVIATGASAVENIGSVGAGHGVLVPGGDTDPCDNGTLYLNFDGSGENGFCWQYGGIVPPYYGAFAECFDGGANTICGIQLLLTGIGYPCQACDLYIWEDGGGIPGNVLTMTSGNNPCPVATWPSISTHDFPITETVTSGLVWVGYWGNFASQPCGYFVAADTDGFGGCPFTNIAPGIGYPTGWNNASTVWGPVQAIGIGAWFGHGGDNPIQETTWGQIKNQY